MLKKLKQKAKQLKSQLYILYLASRHPGTPWYVKALAAVIIAYAISPIDLIPDFIPVLGFLDDIILLPLGIYAVFKLIPKDILAECNNKAEKRIPLSSTSKWITSSVIIAIWFFIILMIIWAWFD